MRMKASQGDKYQKKILSGEIPKEHRKHIEDCFKVHGKMVTAELKKVITTGTRTGRVYYRRGIAHQASAPGEAPASWTGRLANGFEYKAQRRSLVIGSTAFSDGNAPYPKYLDEGTSRMEARPYFVSTIERLHGELTKDLQNGSFLS